MQRALDCQTFIVSLFDNGTLSLSQSRNTIVATYDVHLLCDSATTLFASQSIYSDSLGQTFFLSFVVITTSIIITYPR